MEKYETYQYDVLIIGSGGAGLCAAIAAKAEGVTVGLVCKSLLGKAHTVMAEGGIAAALGNVDPDDNWKVHYKDTIKGGAFINNWRMAEILAKESPNCIKELEQWGALFDRTEDGKTRQRSFGGHTYKRLCHIGDRTGLEVIRTLQDKCVASGVDVHMECIITHILKEDGRVTGAFGIFLNSGKFVVFKSKAVILATGGAGQIWEITSNSVDCTGDGYALAYFAGAELMNMEFVQFHPTGMAWPPGARGLLVTEAVRGDGGVLKNKSGERFMQKYDPVRMELSTRDLVARAIYNEVKQGRGTIHGGVHLDISHKPKDYILKKLPSMYQQFLDLANVDITSEPMEVAPTCHFIMGGVKVNPETCESAVPGLFAAGEVMGGVHGANRLGGNSMAVLPVFGKRAGKYASEYAKKLSGFSEIKEETINVHEKELYSFFENQGDENPYNLHQELKKTMTSNVGIMRNEQGLRAALDKITELKNRYRNISVSGETLYNSSWLLAISLKFMLNIAEAVTVSAIERKESRGAQAREDYPKTDIDWGKKNIRITYQKENPKISTFPIDEMPEELKKLLEEK